MVRAKKDGDSIEFSSDSPNLGSDLDFSLEAENTPNTAHSQAAPNASVNALGQPEPLAVLNAFNEIQAEADAAKHALAHVKTTSMPESVEIPQMSSEASSVALTAEQAAQLIEKRRLRALKEREQGLVRLTTAPTRVGEVVLKRSVEIADVALANMAKRFVFTADRLLSRLHGYGAVIMGEAKAATAVEILTGQIDELHRSAKMLYDQSKQALVLHRDRVKAEGGEWLDVSVANVALAVEVHLLRREGNKFLEAIVLYDKAVKEIRFLEFNYGTESDQVDDAINKIRKEAYKIYRSALAGQVELGRVLAGRKAKSSSNSEKSFESSESSRQRSDAGAAVEA